MMSRCRLLLLLLAVCCGLSAMAERPHHEDPVYERMTREYFEIYQRGTDEKAFYAAAQRMKQYLLQHGDKQLYYIVRTHEVIFDANKGKTWRALQKVNQICKEIEKEKDRDVYAELINYTLGNIYHLRGNYRLAEIYYLKAEEQCHPADTASRLSVYAQMSSLKLPSYPEKAREWIEKLGALTRANSNPEYYKAYLELMAEYYFFSGNRQGFAQTDRQFADYQHRHPQFDKDGEQAMYVMRQAFEGHYHEALRAIDNDTIDFEEVEKPGMRIQIYKMMGRQDLVLDEFLKIKNRRDSLDTDMLFDGMNEIGTQASLTHRMRDMADQNRRWLVVSLLVIIALLVMALLFFVYHHLLRRRYQKNIEQKNRELSEALSQAKESDRMKTVFIEHVSHEIRTPLNIVTGYAQLIGNPKYKISATEHVQMVETICENSAIITNVINELLDIAQYSTKKRFVCDDVINVRKFCEKLVEASEEKNGGRLTITIDDTCPDDYTIRSNQMALERVLMQLLDNAIKFTEEGHVFLSFHADEAAHAVQFAVADTGIGIAADYHEKVFERFFKIDMFRQGFGLGLSICRKVSELIGATLVIDADYKEGARFVLTLPMEESGGTQA